MKPFGLPLGIPVLVLLFYALRSVVAPQPRNQHLPTTLASTTQIGQRLLVTDKAPAQYHPIHYEYIMPEEQQKRLLREVPKLRVGDSVESVVERLGPPLRDTPFYGPVTLLPSLSNKPHSRDLTYFFATRELQGSNVYDPCVAAFFDENDRLERIASTVPELPSLNWFRGDTTATPEVFTPSATQR